LTSGGKAVIPRIALVSRAKRRFDSSVILVRKLPSFLTSLSFCLPRGARRGFRFLTRCLVARLISGATLRRRLGRSRNLSKGCCRFRFGRFHRFGWIRPDGARLLFDRRSD